MPLLDYWPVAVVAATGLVAWGDLRSKVRTLDKDVNDKAGKDVVAQIDKRLDSMDQKLDRLIERGAA